jgi:hypothetical protein
MWVFYTFSKQRTKILEDFNEKLNMYYVLKGARGGIVVKALLYEPAGRGFDFR